MKIVGIFAVVNNSLLAVKFEGKESQEFRLLFTNWQDIEYLRQFFKDNIRDLQSGFFGNITVDEAVKCTIEESEEMEAYILNVAKTGQIDLSASLQNLIFTPLHKYNESNVHLQSKAYGLTKPSWLRIYAIRIGPNHYVVSGGAIKLTETMNGVPHLENELKKLKLTREYLKEIGLLNEDDFEFIEISSYDK